MIITVSPPKELAEKLKVEGGLKPETLHFTLFFLGETEDVSQEKYTEYVKLLQETADETKPFTIRITDSSRFEKVRMTTDEDGNTVPATQPTDVVYLSGDSPELIKLREKLANALDNNDLYFSKVHKTFVPHMSLKYVPHDAELYLDYEFPIEFECSSIELWGNGTEFKQVFEFGG